MFAALIDAGPLIALSDRSDRHHTVCTRTLAQLPPRLGTVWPVLTEVMYLLNRSERAQKSLWDLIDAGILEIAKLELEDCSRMRELMEKYHDLPMDLADAAIVRVAEREQVRRVFTIDRRDFSIYRPDRIGRFEIIP